MVKVRQDAWSHEDDLLLAETVLRHIREGSTQLNAFEEVGDALNRTAAACGFRWNAEVRQNYEKAVDLAKRQRKERKRAQKQSQPVAQAKPEEPNNLPAKIDTPQIDAPANPSIDHIIQQLQLLKTAFDEQQHINQVQSENHQLKEENDTLRNELHQLQSQYDSLQDDYQTFIAIMDRARKMMIFDESDTDSPTFQMEKNGNLQQVAK
ncbi:prespore-specific regulator [Alkalibacillus flavidus]|uniref:Prespore-specific regulator n=1 Tax=Alkalibacillus flavidus TaxID=546021 RepID=A0ABV2KT00_9BACI